MHILEIANNLRKAYEMAESGDYSEETIRDTIESIELLLMDKADAFVNLMTGGGVLTAARKYENEFEFKPEFKIWMPTNHKPKIYGTDVGIWSRIRQIPFTVRIPDERMDKTLRQKLMREAPGILKWAVEGCLMWQREGLEPPKAVADATATHVARRLTGPRAGTPTGCSAFRQA